MTRFPNDSLDAALCHGDLLLQIDSTNDVSFGDSGVANFFISPSDLERLDFSRVLYTWDCY